MSKTPEAADLKSEKTKDIRMTNIIAARGTFLIQIVENNNSNHFTCSCG